MFIVSCAIVTLDGGASANGVSIIVHKEGKTEVC